MNYQAILNAKASQFELVNTHELKEGDIILHMGMVIVVGEKQISTSHKDQGYGECQYHKSRVVATAPSVGDMTSWNVQGNKLAMWSKWIG